MTKRWIWLVCQGAISGIDSDRTIGYRWHDEGATEGPGFDDLEEAVNWTWDDTNR